MKKIITKQQQQQQDKVHLFIVLIVIVNIIITTKKTYRKLIIINYFFFVVYNNKSLLLLLLLYGSGQTKKKSHKINTLISDWFKKDFLFFSFFWSKLYQKKKKTSLSKCSFAADICLVNNKIHPFDSRWIGWMEREKKGIIIKFDEQKQKISNEFLTVMDVWCPHTHNNDVDDDGGQ